jgi:cyclomaltodextrinase / maltogenic alpha-amylase / neopullulanase
MSKAWLKNAVIYHILIDRFAKGGIKGTIPFQPGPVFLGGDIAGIIEKLPYIESLGANAIWLSPFNTTNAYHGYHVEDFYNVDPRFGSIEILQKLIKKAHAKNIRVIMDFVPNHVSNQHPYFREARLDKKSQYSSWFYFKQWPDSYVRFLSFDELVKLNLDYVPAREHVIEAALFWLEKGIDGLRIDHVAGVKPTFWKEFKQRVNEKFPNTVLIGEAWMSGIKFRELNTINIPGKYITLALYKMSRERRSDRILKEYIPYFDGVLDFQFQKLMELFITKKNIVRTTRLLKKKIQKHYTRFPDDYALATFLDNHDMNRFLYYSKDNKTLLKQALTIQAEQDQPMIIYYGTELGLSHRLNIKSFDAHGDLEARRPMPWDSPDEEIHEFYKNIIAKRISR